MAFLIFSSLKMGKLTFTWRHFLNMLTHNCCQMFLSLLNVPSFDHFLYQNFHPWRGGASRKTSRNPWCSLSPASSATCIWASSTGITGHSHLPIRCSLIQASHPIIYITGTSQGPDGSPQPLGAAQVPGLHFLPQDSICNSSVAFLQVMGGILWLTSMEWWSGGSIPLHTSACFCSILSFTPFCRPEVLFIYISLRIWISH